MQRQAVTTSHQQPHTFGRAPPPPSQLYCRGWCYLAWNSPVVCLAQLSLLCPLPASHPPSLLTAGGGQHEKQRRPWCHSSAVQQQPKHQHVIDTVLATNRKVGTVQAATKGIGRIPARPSIGITPPGLQAQLYWGASGTPGPLHNQWEG